MVRVSFVHRPLVVNVYFSFNYNKIHRQLGINLTFIFFQALLRPELSETEVKMSEKTERLVHIIMPDLLNYLEMVESGEIIEKRLEKNLSCEQKEENKNIQSKKIENK